MTLFLTFSLCCTLGSSRSPQREPETLEMAKDTDLPDYTSSQFEVNVENGTTETPPTSSSTNSTLEICRVSLCPEAIANIALAGFAMVFLGICACVLWHWEAYVERRDRIRHARARNRAIDRHLEAAKKPQQNETLFVTSVARDDSSLLPPEPRLAAVHK